MTEIQRSALVPFAREQMFDLVADIESYPEFLPWCRAAVVHCREDNRVEASLVLARGPIRKTLTTVNAMSPPERITMSALRGPFRSLHGRWSFEDIGGRGTRVSLEMRFEFESRLLARSLGPVFSEIANTLVDAFARRAHAIYGSSSACDR